MSDEWKSYNCHNSHYEHHIVEHGKGQYVSENAIYSALEKESLWYNRYCRAVTLMVNPLLIHDKLLLYKGVEKGGSHDETTSRNNKSCPLRTWTAFASYF